MDRHKTIIFMFDVKIKIWCDVPLTAGMYKTYACSVMGMNYNVHEMMRNESYSRAQRISTSKPLHTPSSAMRSTDDTHERCNQERTCIMSCVWDHAHDVLLPGPEQRFTDEFLASWFYLVTKHGFKSVCIMSNVYEIMSINECVIEDKTAQWVNKFFYVIHVSFTSLAVFYCPLLDNPQGFFQSWKDIRRSSSSFAYKEMYDEMCP